MDKDFQLAKKLLQRLNAENRWFTLGEIESELMISDKTIRRIVAEINGKLPPTIDIQVSRGKGMYLNIEDPNYTIKDVISALFRKTTYYCVLHALFQNNGTQSLDEMAESLFMSASSLKKAIIQLNKKDLNEYDLRITYATPQIKGNEIKIRYFYWRLYSEAYEFTGWPFTNIKEEKMHQLIQKCEQIQGVQFFINSKRRLAFLLAITCHRVEFHNYIKLANNHFDWENEKFYSAIEMITQDLSFYTSNVWPVHEQYFLQAMFSRSQYSYLPTDNLLSVKKDETVDVMVQQFLKILVEALPNIDRNERFIAEIYDFFTKLLIDNAIPELLEVLKSNLTYYVRKELQVIDEKVAYCVEEWAKRYPNVSYNTYHLTRLTLLVSTHLIYKSKKAFLLIGEEFSIRHYVAKLIKKEIGDELVISTSIMEGLTDEAIQRDGIDFVISNFPIELKTVPVLVISTIPTKRDLARIRQQLLQ